MGITSGPKSIRAFQEIRLKHRLQYPRDRSLQQAIFDRRYSERPRPCLARSFRYLHSAHRCSPIGPSLQAFAQLLNSCVQALFKLLCRLTINTARTPPVHLLPGFREEFRCEQMRISWGKLSHFPCTIAESTLRTLMDYGLRGTLPSRPLRAPSIRFLSIDSHVCSMLPSDPASRQ